MTDAEPVAGIERSTTKIKIDPPWWQKTAFLVFLVSLGLAVLLFAVAALQGSASARHDRSEALKAEAVAKAQVDALTTKNAEQDELTTRQQECRAQRNAELNAITAAITREKSKLDVIVARAVFERLPTAAAEVQPYFDTLNQLADLSTKAEAAVRVAVDECRDGVN